MESTTSTSLDKLSNREYEVLDLLSKGCSREMIAHKMGISKLTYDSYRKSIRGKLDIKSQSDWGRILHGFSMSNYNTNS